MDTYYNTVNESGRMLDDYTAKAMTQEDRILEYYRNHRHLAFSPTQIQGALCMHGVPITSIRRAITNLTNRGELVKTGKKARGMYGRDEYCWRFRIRTKAEQQEMEL